MRDLLQALEGEKAKARAFLAENKVAEAENVMTEVKALQKKITMQQELEAIEDIEIQNSKPINKGEQDLEAEYRQVFLKGLRLQRIDANDRSIANQYRAAVMHEGGIAAGQDDGTSDLIVPQDIQTNIHNIMRTLNDLSKYIHVETVNTLSGSRVLERDEAITPFQPVAEYGALDVMDNPQFTPVVYELVKRAGYLPLTNELLKDTDQNILAYVANWIARKHVITKNSLIIAILNAMDKEGLADLKAIKKTLNIDLDPALIKTGGIILTNQDGYNWLDEQVDGQGRFLLQDDITQPGRKLFRGLPVAVAANRYLPSDSTSGTKAPFIMGNLKQSMVLFTRGQYELSSTREGGDAWRRDTTELRAITRDDCVVWDSGAAVFGQLTITGK